MRLGQISAEVLILMRTVRAELDPIVFLTMGSGLDHREGRDGACGDRTDQPYGFQTFDGYRADCY